MTPPPEIAGPARSIALLLALVGPVAAHEFGSTRATVTLDPDRVEVEVVLRPADARRIAGDGPTLARHVRERVTLWSGSRRLAGRLVAADRARVVLSYDLAGAERDLALSIEPLADVDPESACFARIVDGRGRDDGHVFRPGSRLRLDRGPVAGPAPGLVSFVGLGVRHILGGLDHVLFLVALLLVVPDRRSLVRLVTAFTVGHSLTLALAALDLLVLSGRLVEAAIALSIVHVALANLLVPEPGHRVGPVLLFGLVHGLGFSTVLVEAAPGPSIVGPLAAFNAGVEIGQLYLVALVGPLLVVCRRRRPRAARGIRVVGSLAILVLSLVWFVERVS